MTDIGTILKEARKEKGLTLDDLQQTTKIQKRYLIAIEDGDFAALPGKFYVRAFIKQYAETVGIDPEELLAKLDEDKAPKLEETEATTRTEAVKREEEKTMSPILAGLIRYLPTIIIVSIVVAILGTIYIFAWGDRDRNSSTQMPITAKKSQFLLKVLLRAVVLRKKLQVVKVVAAHLKKKAQVQKLRRNLKRQLNKRSLILQLRVQLSYMI